MVGPFEVASAAVFGSERDERCISAVSALDDGKLPGALFLISSATAQGIEISNINLRVQTQDLTVISRGCTGDQFGTIRERNITVACSDEKARRCGSCILNVLDRGEEIQAKLIKSGQSRH